MTGASGDIRAAEGVMADAKRVAEATAIARDRLRADLRGIEIEAHLADVGAIIAVNALLAPEIERLVPRAEEASRTLTRSCAVLNYLQRRNLTGAGSNASDREVDDATLTGLPWSERELVERAKQVIPTELQARARSLVESCPRAQFNLSPDVLQLVAAWRETRAQLSSDAGADVKSVAGSSESRAGIK